MSYDGRTDLCCTALAAIESAELRGLLFEGLSIHHGSESQPRAGLR